MKLYVFDSCPYCTKVRAYLAIAKLECEISFLIAGQWPSHFQRQLSQLSVPVLEYTGADGQKKLIAESDQIIDYLSTVQQVAAPSPSLHRQGIDEILGQIAPTVSQLCYPRMTRCQLPELNSEQAMLFFKQSRPEAMGMSFAQALAATERLCAALTTALKTLSELLQIADLLDDNRAVNRDDLMCFALLRNLSMVAELALPRELQDYRDKLEAMSAIAMYPAVEHSA